VFVAGKGKEMERRERTARDFLSNSSDQAVIIKKMSPQREQGVREDTTGSAGRSRDQRQRLRRRKKATENKGHCLKAETSKNDPIRGETYFRK